MLRHDLSEKKCSLIKETSSLFNHGNVNSLRYALTKHFVVLTRLVIMAVLLKGKFAVLRLSEIGPITSQEQRSSKKITLNSS